MKDIRDKLTHASLKYQASIVNEADITKLRLPPVRGNESELIVDTTGNEMTRLSSVIMDDEGYDEYSTVLFTNERIDFYESLTPVLLFGYLAADAQDHVKYILNEEEKLGLKIEQPCPHGDNTLTIKLATYDGVSLFHKPKHMNALYSGDTVSISFEYKSGHQFVIRTAWLQNMVNISLGNVSISKLFVGDMSWSVVFEIILEFIPELVVMHDTNNELELDYDIVSMLRDDIRSLLASAKALEERGLSRFDFWNTK